MINIPDTINIYTWSIVESLLLPRYDLAGCGIQMAALSFGGHDGTNYVANTEKFNGLTWLTSTNLLEAKSGLGGCGVQNSAIAFAGLNDSNHLNSTEKFNGSAWVADQAMITLKSQVGSAGAANAAISFGGSDSSWDPIGNVELYNGTAWSVGQSLLTIRTNISGCGTSNSTLSTGGYVSTYLSIVEKFNGTNWVTTTNMIMARDSFSTAGLQNNALAMGGHGTDSYLKACEKFDGTSWIAAENLNKSRSGTAKAGDSSTALIFSDDGAEKYNGFTLSKRISNLVETDIKNRASNLQMEVQRANVPTFIDIKPTVSSTYFYNDMERPVDRSKQVVIKTNLLPIKSLYSRRGKLSFTSSMINMIDRNEIHPFLLFINNKFIKWSSISIISEYGTYFIVVAQKIPTITSIDVIKIPFNVTYVETGASPALGYKTIFRFSDTTGLLDDLGKIVISTVANINTIDKTYTNAIQCEKTNDLVDFTKYQIFKENVSITFKNGLLNKPKSVSVYGFNTFEVINPDGIDSTGLRVKGFFYNKTTVIPHNYSFVKNLNTVQDEYIYAKLHSDETPPTYMKNITKTVDDISYNKNNRYETNIFNAVQKVMKNNPSYMNSVYENDSNTFSVTYTGAQINTMKDSNSILKLPRRRVGVYDDYLIVFVNGDVYQYYMDMSYKTNTFELPIIDIADDDKVELMFFRNIDNRANKIVLSEDEPFTYLDENLDITNILLYSKEPEIADYLLPESNRVQYDVPYTITKLDNGKVKITPNSNFYYNRELTLVSSNQFHYVGYNILHEEVGVTLSPEFNYAHDESRYLVFINSRKINRDNYKLTIIAPNVPFNDISAYLNIPLVKDDKIEVFYIPSSTQEFYIEKEVFLEDKVINNGDIVLNKSALTNSLEYNLSNNLYLYFINGRKISPNEIIDIDDNHIRISIPMKSCKNLCIMKHIPNIPILTNLFVTSDWSTLIKSVADSDRINEFLGITDNTSITDTEEDIFANIIPFEPVIREIFRDYWMKTGVVDAGKVFVYDYEVSLLTDETDPDGNVIIDVMDASKEKNIELEDYPLYP